MAPKRTPASSDRNGIQTLYADSSPLADTSCVRELARALCKSRQGCKLDCLRPPANFFLLDMDPFE
jgi:hypothetical protein